MCAELIYEKQRESMELIEAHNLQRHFQRCVTLSAKIRMAAVTRVDGEDCAGRMFELIKEHLSVI